MVLASMLSALGVVGTVVIEAHSSLHGSLVPGRVVARPSRLRGHGSTHLLRPPHASLILALFSLMTLPLLVVLFVPRWTSTTQVCAPWQRGISAATGRLHRELTTDTTHKELTSHTSY